MIIYVAKELRFLLKNLKHCTDEKLRKYTSMHGEVYFSVEATTDYVRYIPSSEVVKYFTTYEEYFKKNKRKVREIFVSYCFYHFIQNKMIEEILSSFESRDSAVAELKRYKEDYPEYPDYNYYKYGNCRIYFEDLRKFFLECGYTKLPASSFDVEKLYMRYVRSAINAILEAVSNES